MELSNVAVIDAEPNPKQARVRYYLTLSSTHLYAHADQHHPLRQAREYPNSRKKASIKARYKFVGQISEETQADFTSRR